MSFCGYVDPVLWANHIFIHGQLSDSIIEILIYLLIPYLEFMVKVLSFIDFSR